MRHHHGFILAGLLATVFGCVEREPSPIPIRPRIDYAGRAACLKREITEAVTKLPDPYDETGTDPNSGPEAFRTKLAAFSSVKKEIAKKAIISCTAQYGGDPNDWSIALTADDDAYEASQIFVHREEARSMERLRQEQAEDKAKLDAEGGPAADRYGDCLFRGAHLIASESTETAEIVARASFALCRPERNALLGVHQRYHDRFFDAATMDKIDAGLLNRIILEVIKARAAPSPPASTVPAAKPDKTM